MVWESPQWSSPLGTHMFVSGWLMSPMRYCRKDGAWLRNKSHQSQRSLCFTLSWNTRSGGGHMAAMLWRRSSSLTFLTVRNSRQQPCEWDLMEADLLAPVKPSRDNIPRRDLGYTLSHNHPVKPLSNSGPTEPCKLRFIVRLFEVARFYSSLWCSDR